MGRRKKGRTIAGQRIPIELNFLVTQLQLEARRFGKKLSRQDILRQIARRFPKRK